MKHFITRLTQTLNSSRIKRLIKKSGVALIGAVLPIMVVAYTVFASLDIMSPDVAARVNHPIILAMGIAVMGYMLSIVVQRWLMQPLSRRVKNVVKKVRSLAIVRSGVQSSSTQSSSLHKADRSNSPSRTFFITGANRGIGLALTQQLLQRGHQVIASVRDQAHIPALEASVSTPLRERLQVVECDLVEHVSIQQIAKRLTGQAIDCLIHNGVVGPERQSLEQLDMKNVETAFKVNSIAPLSLTQALLPNLRAGNSKKVVAISSDLASAGRPNPCLLYAYQASKAALNQVVILLAKEWQYEDFTCFAIHPGSVNTRLNPSGHMTPDQSAIGIIDCIEQATSDDNGQWVDVDNQPVPW